MKTSHVETSSGVYFELVGNEKGMPVYVFHTSPFDHSYMKKGLEYDEDTYGFYFFDLPNHGKSDDKKIDDLSFLKIAKLIEEFRRSQNHEEVILIGHGIGGFVAQSYATRFKKQTKSLIISNSASNSRYRTEMAWNIRDQLSKVTKQKIADYQGSTDHDSLLFRFSQSLSTYFTEDFHDQAEPLLSNLERFPSDAYVTIANFMIPKYDVREGLQSFDKPVLIISGKHDVWPKSILEFYHTDIPHAKFVEIESGHFPMIEKPIEFWNEIIQFIQK